MFACIHSPFADFNHHLGWETTGEHRHLAAIQHHQHLIRESEVTNLKWIKIVDDCRV